MLMRVNYVKSFIGNGGNCQEAKEYCWQLEIILYGKT